LAHLYAVIVARRARLPRLLYSTVRSRYRETQLGVRCGFLHRAWSWIHALRCACRPCCCCCPAAALECLVCGAPSGRGGPAFQTCAGGVGVGGGGGGVCRAAYCCQCFDDLDRVCPLCLHGAGGELSGGYYDALNEDEDFGNSLDDELKSYCKTSVTGV